MEINDLGESLEKGNETLEESIPLTSQDSARIPADLPVILPSKRRRNGGKKLEESFEYFVKDDCKMATCKLCRNNQETKLIKMTDSNTSGLKRHLKNCHEKEYYETYPAIQNTIEPFEQGTFNKKIVDWVTKKYLPFSFFEDDCTRDLFRYLNPEVELPLRNELQSQVTNRFINMQNAVMKILKENKSKISFTLDGWTSVSNKSYFGITGHFINDDWDLESFVVDFVPTDGFHAGYDIAKVFHETLKKYDIENKLQAITVDNTSANTKFMEQLTTMMKNFNSKDQHYQCYAHIINLGAQALLKVLKLEDPYKDNDEATLSEEVIEDEDVADDDPDEVIKKKGLYCQKNGKISPLAKLRSLFHFLKVSEQRKNKLKMCCEVCNNKYSAPNLDVSTRWNSSFEMLRKAFEMQEAAGMLCQNNAYLKHLYITPSQWLPLREAAKYLEYFKILSDVLGGEKYVTLPTVVVGFNLLLDKLEEAKINLSENDSRTAVEDNILKALESSLNKLLKHYHKSNWIYCSVLILDPRHKTKTFKKTVSGLEMAAESKKKFENIFKKEYFTPIIPVESEETEKTTVHTSTKEFDVNALYDSDSESESTVSQVSNQNSWRKELDSYLQQKRAGRNTNILDWWRKNQNVYPNLAKMGRDFLSTPATSVPSERLFWRSSLTVRKHRNRLSDNICNGQTGPSAVFCSGCNAPYHPSCAKRTTKLVNAAYKKCCGSESVTPTVPPGSAFSFETGNVTSLASQSTTSSPISVDVKQIIDLAFSQHISSMSTLIKNLSDTLSAKLDTVSTRIDSAENAHTELLTRVTDAEGKISSLRAEIRNLKSDRMKVNECLSEMEKRTTRKNNIILFGVPEQVSSGNVSSDPLHEEKAAVTRLCGSVISPGLLADIVPKRLGINSQNNQKPRPLRITFDNQDRAHSFYHEFLICKKQSNLNEINSCWITFDRTRMQLQELAVVRQEMHRRLQAGEMGLRIVFRRGNPIIIQSSTNPLTTVGTTNT